MAAAFDQRLAGMDDSDFEMEARLLNDLYSRLISSTAHSYPHRAEILGEIDADLENSEGWLCKILK